MISLVLSTTVANCIATGHGQLELWVAIRRQCVIVLDAGIVSEKVKGGVCSVDPVSALELAFGQAKENFMN